MKRHPDLREFSDDQHLGLVNAFRLKRTAAGEGVTPVEAAQAFLKFWREDPASISGKRRRCSCQW